MKRYLLLLLAVTVLALAACAPAAEGSSSQGAETVGSSGQPDGASQPESSSGGEASTPVPDASEPSPEPSSEAPPAASSAPSGGVPPASGWEPVPDAEPAGMEQVFALQAYLFDTLPQTDYAYLNAGAREGFLTVGYLDLAAVQAAVDGYDGPACPVIYEAAECSVADTLAFLDAVDSTVDFPAGAYVEPISDIPGAFEGAELGIRAADDEQAQEIEDAILALARETGFPQQYLVFYHMTLGYNPDT